MQEINIHSYHEFFQQTLKAQELFDRLRDARKRPQVPTGLIAQAIVYSLSAGQKSLLSIDNLLSSSDLGSILGFARSPVCSDSLMAQVLKTMDPQEIRQILYQLADVLIRLRLITPQQQHPGLRAIAIDGTTFLGREVVVCYWISQAPYVALDFEPVLNGENEIEAAKRLLPRTLERFGWAIDIVVGDGLYTGWFLKICLKHHKDAVAKLREEDARGLKIIQAVRQRLEEQHHYGVPAQEGIDEDGQRCYALRELGTWEAFELAHKIRVVWSRQIELKGPKRHDEHWLLTSLSQKQASALVIRTIGRWRWHIENNGFRELNQKMGRKHRYTRHEMAAQIMTGLLLIAQTALQGYILWRRQSDRGLCNPKVTAQWMMRLLLGSILQFKPQQHDEQEGTHLLLFSDRTMRRLICHMRRSASG